MLYLKTAVCLMAVFTAVIIGGLSCRSTGIDLSNCRPLVTEADNGKETQMEKGNILCLKLPAQMGTGFAWHVKNVTPLLKSQGDPVQVPTEADKKVGGYEDQVFKFSAIEAGAGELELVYKRAWEKSVQPLKSFKVTVTIR